MPKKKEEGIGKTVRDWLTEKMGNPIMPSKEKQQIDQLEREDRERYEKQERGEDYPAKEHVRRSKNIRGYRG